MPLAPTPGCPPAAEPRGAAAACRAVAKKIAAAMTIAGIGLDDRSGVIALPSLWRVLNKQHHKIMTFSGRTTPAQPKGLNRGSDDPGASAARVLANPIHAGSQARIAPRDARS